MARIGRYEVESSIGKGAFGEVFRARLEGPLGFEKAVALKRIHSGSSGQDERWLASVANEARLGALLVHRNIVEVYELLEEGGAWYIAMEHLRGATLDRVLARCHRTGALLPGAAALEVGIHLCEGLAYAHAFADERTGAVGVVHRDLKPGNLMLCEDGTLKILDFGLARFASSPGQTSRGIVKGTPAYMSPEQVRGARELGPASDLYALGAILYELFTARRLVVSESVPEAMHRIAYGDFASELAELARLFEPIQPLVARCLAKDPLQRWGSAEALGQELRNLRGAGAPLLPELASVVCKRGARGEALGPFAERFLAAVPDPWEPTPAPRSDPELDYGETAMSPQSSRGTSAQKRIRLGKAVPAAVAAALLAAAGSAAWWHHSWLLRRGAQAAASSSPEVGVLRRVREIPVPVDAQEILSYENDSVIVAGPAGAYQVPVSIEALVSNAPLQPGDRVLGGADGLTFLARPAKNGFALVGATFSANRSKVWAGHLPPGTPVAISGSGQWIALERERAIDVYATQRLDAPAVHFDVGELGPGRSDPIALGEQWVAIFDKANRDIRAARLDGGAQVGPIHLTEEGVLTGLALEEERGLLAIATWSATVRVLDLSTSTFSAQLAYRGKPQDLAWVPDGPTLLIAGVGGISAWRPGSQAVETVDMPDASIASIRLTGATLTALDTRNARLVVLEYRGIPGLAARKVAPMEVWGMARGAEGTLLAGGPDGALREIRPEQVIPHALHTDGITAIVGDGERVATASDDRTIAVWKLSGMTVERRSNAHAYLVNQLALLRDPPELWSASSDGSIKRWSWPELEEREELSTAALLGKKYSLQSVAVAPDRRTVVAGTWDDAAIVFEREERGWRARVLPVPSRALYSAAAVPGINALALVGLQPDAPYLYDVGAQRLEPLPGLGLQPQVVVPLADGHSVAMIGAGSVVRYGFAKGPGGAVQVTASARVDTRLGDLLAGVERPDGSLAVANSAGELFDIPRDVPEQPLAAAPTP